jgi:sugar phosphate isomerase/epimerase
MPIFSVNQLTTMQWTLEEDVLFYCDNGFRAIGLSLNKVESFGREKSKELIHDLGMEVSSLGSIGFHNDIAGTTLDDQIDEAKDAVVVAAELAAHCLILHTGGIAGHLKKNRFRLISTVLDELLPFAEDHGVRLAIEPLSAEPSSGKTFSHDWEDVIQIIDRFRSKQLGINLDIFHCGFKALTHFGPLFARFVFLLQICDYFHKPRISRRRPKSIHFTRERCPFGGGNFDINDFQRFISQDEFQGIIEFEQFGESFDSIPYASTIQNLANEAVRFSHQDVSKLNPLKV